MVKFSDMVCRDCGQMIVPRAHSTTRAASHNTCNYVCANIECGVAYSNTKNAQQRTKIYPRKELNVPAEVRGSLDDVLSRSLNIRNRASKAARFAFETSEDALTWTAFRYLQSSGQICGALDLPPGGLDAMLLWGAGGTGGEDTAVSDALKRELIEALGERPNSLTEPDVVILAGGWLVFVEVKYGSANSCRPDYHHFDRYLEAGRSLFAVEPSRVKADGYEELVRNWVAGADLARTLRKSFLLVNLTGDGCSASANRFAASLDQTPERTFRHLTWPALRARLRQPVEPWFASYLDQKRIPST